MLKSIYEIYLGEEYQKLHPKLQHRYHISMDKSFYGKGVMKEIKGGNLFTRSLLWFGTFFKLFFPERGEDIPFEIFNTVGQNSRKGEWVEWTRSFQFGVKLRYFNAAMYLDEKKNEMVDYFGEPTTLISTLNFLVGPNGEMIISSKKQWFNFFSIWLPLPKWMYGDAVITESYDDEGEQYHISVEVNNKVLGSLFSYKGTFVEVEEDIDYEG